MNWIPLTNLEQLESIGDAEGYSVIFKHSTRCSVSLMAKKRFEHDWDAIPAATSVYFLDLISNREISNTIAQKFSVHHESPQLLLIKMANVFTKLRMERFLPKILQNRWPDQL